MINVDKGKFSIDGDVITVISEIGSMFGSLNQFFEAQGEMKDIIEETCVCNEKAYKKMQILMVRLENAHKRALETKKANNLNF